jgi:hypothetical protein
VYLALKKFKEEYQGKVCSSFIQKTFLPLKEARVALSSGVKQIYQLLQAR